jgi:hypothetical protein
MAGVSCDTLCSMWTDVLSTEKVTWLVVTSASNQVDLNPVEMISDV